MLKFLKKYKYIITIIFVISTIITIIIAKNNLVMASEGSSYLVTDDLITKEEESTDENNDNEKENNNQTMYVEIKGAVQNPGVYPIEENNRVIDIIGAAGGITENADLSVTNQARLLKDQDIIIIYTKEEVANCKQKATDSEQTQESNCSIYKPDINIDECPTPFSEEDNSNLDEQEPNTNEANIKININTATLEELTTLDGIGTTKAEAIINYRTEHGKFTNIEDLKNVSGIGESTYEKIKDHITT